MTYHPDLTIRFAQPDDYQVIFNLIQELAKYEKLSHALTGNAEALRQHLFGEKKYIEALLAEFSGQVVGQALFFHNYSTFLTKPGIYLEDLFVLPDFRRRGIGKALLNKLAQVAVERDCGRLEWTVLDWNTPAQEFYLSIGATIIKEWQICRVNEVNLKNLATQI